MSIKYSIVMVTYNHEKYISKAIDSVLRQNTNNSYEILIGDDGSNDRTVEILSEYKRNYNFINVFAHKNIGLSKNVYQLLMNAKGEYIAILEGDDYWIDDEKLEKQRNIIEQNHCLATACNSLKIDEHENELGLWNERKKSKILSKTDIFKYQTKLWHPSALMFKNIFLNSGDRYKVIADASRMGGNHSGLINLLADNGDIYLDITPMAIWLSIQKPGATNYSSQKNDTLYDYYEAMRKYQYYNDFFKMDYSRIIFSYYRLCKHSLYKEATNNTGIVCYYRGMISFYFYALLGKICRLFNK